MEVFFHKYFQKRYRKSSSKIQDKFDAQLDIFYSDMYDERLNNHELHGKYANHRSINVTGNIRAIYRKVNKATDDVIFLDIGTHPELYS